MRVKAVLGREFSTTAGCRFVWLGRLTWIQTKFTVDSRGLAEKRMRILTQTHGGPRMAKRKKKGGKGGLIPLFVLLAVIGAVATNRL